MSIKLSIQNTFREVSGVIIACILFNVKKQNLVLAPQIGLINIKQAVDWVVSCTTATQVWRLHQPCDMHDLGASDVGLNARPAPARRWPTFSWRLMLTRSVVRDIPVKTQNICITFVQCWTNVEDVGPTLYKCYVNVLCLLGLDQRKIAGGTKRWHDETIQTSWVQTSHGGYVITRLSTQETRDLDIIMRVNVGPASYTVARHCLNIVSICVVFAGHPVRCIRMVNVYTVLGKRLIRWTNFKTMSN